MYIFQNVCSGLVFVALRIHISPDTAKLLDVLGGYNLIERGPITIKVSIANASVIFSVFKA
jgi:hypothetical protein